MIETPEWMKDALCLKKHGDIWFPPFETNTPEIYYYVARCVCDICPVWDKCLEMGKKEVYGMWGGLTPQERLPLQKETRADHLAEHGTTTRFKQGCECFSCRASYISRVQKSTEILDIVPNQNETFDIRNVAERLQQT